MAYSEAEILELSKRIGSGTTLWRWASQGCDLRSHASVQTWIEKNRLRETNVTKSKRRRDHESDKYLSVPVRRRAVTLAAMGDLPPIGKKGAAAALERLEASEERAHARPAAALVRGDSIRSRRVRNFGCDAVRRFAGLILRSRSHVARKKLRFRFGSRKTQSPRQRNGCESVSRFF